MKSISFKHVPSTFSDIVIKTEVQAGSSRKAIYAQRKLIWAGPRTLLSEALARLTIRILAQQEMLKEDAMPESTPMSLPSDFIEPIE